MTSEIRANTIKNRVGLGTVSFTNTGTVVSGIVTSNTLRLPDATSGSLGRLQIGNGLDLSLFHNGTNSFLVNNTGYLSIQSQDGVNGIFIARNAEVNLYFGPSVRLQTSSSGVTINRDLDVDGHTNLDNVSIAGVTTFTGNPTIHNADPQLTFRDSNHSPFYYYLKGRTGAFVIEDSVNGDRISLNANGSISFHASTTVFTGGAQISTNLGVTGNIILGDQIQHNGDTDTKIRFPSADTITFETGGTERVRINSNGLTVPDGDVNNNYISAGNSQDIKIFHDGSHSYIRDIGTGGLRITTNSFNVLNSSNGESMITGTEDGAVKLYYDHNLRLETSGSRTIFRGSGGIGVYGDAGSNQNGQISLHPTGSAVYTNLFFYNAAGNSYASIVGHDGGTLFFTGGTNGPLRHRVNGTGFHSFQDGNTQRVTITAGGTVNIGGDFTNTTGKLKVTGNSIFTGDIDVDGHTELDNVNIVGVTTHNGTTNLYGNGGASVVWGDTGYTGHLSFDGSSNAVIRAASGKALIFQTNHVNERLRIHSDGQVQAGTSNPTYLKYSGSAAPTNNNNATLLGSNNIGLIGQYSSINMPFDHSTASNSGSWWMLGRSAGTSNEWGLYTRSGGLSNLLSVWKVVGSSNGHIQYQSFSTGGGSERLRITSGGQLLLNETSAFDSNTGIQFRYDNSGNTADFVFRNRGNNSNSRVNIKLSTLNRAANADVSSGIEKYQNGGMSIYNGENTNQYSNINFFTNGWRSLQLRNGNHSGAWCAEIDAYWGTSNGLRMEVGGPQSGTWQAIDFHTSHTGTQRGYIGVTYGGVSYNSSSDYRMKQDVVDLTSAIDRVKSLKPKRFRWKEDLTHTVDGFLAHEAQTVVPESVQGEKDGEQMQVMDNSKLVPLLTAALKEAITEIETLKTKVAALEG